MAILGLVIQKPDSVSGVGRRLAERFPQARFARNAAHNNLPSLRRQGLVRLVEGDGLHPLDRYEASPLGVERFREWMRASQAAVPVLRDGLRVTLECIADEADLHIVREAVREQEHACLVEYEAAHARLRAAQRSRLRSAVADDWHAAVQNALLIDETMLWGQRAMRLKRLRECLQYIDDGDGYDDS
jgi:hypothetical protein